ncbi:chitobiase/beta-hexosaminidase C-terminal domain-containing protein [Compostibacter hankyongensis]|uniref:PA14 domain-containing protein n=1 Tax=Compostibacter hankyongensis TaxID=1007089 RepID=A0ABP8G8Q5_9BACT
MKHLIRLLSFAFLLFHIPARSSLARPLSPALKVPVASAGPGDSTHGLIGSYYTYTDANNAFAASPLMVRIDSTVKFNWGTTSGPFTSHPEIIDNFSIRWVGLIEAPVSGEYTFYTNTDDGSRIWINGQSVIDYWTTCCSEHSGKITLEAGRKYPIIWEFHEGGGGANALFFDWAAPGIGRQAVPSRYLYALEPQTAGKPQISPPGGLYEDSVVVKISTATPNAEIRYTTDGSAPTTNALLYKDSIILNEYKTTQIRAKTFADGMFASEEVSSAYNVVLPIVEAPEFTPPGGVYDSSLKVTITSGEQGAVIHYTLDGTDPNEGSPVYTAPVVIDSTLRVRAFAVKEGMTPSTISSATYTLIDPQVAAPEFSVEEGTYETAQKVAITSDTKNAVIHYTLDGSEPDQESPVYKDPLLIDTTTTIYAYAEKGSTKPSTVSSATYTILKKSGTVASPEFSVPAGTYDAPQKVGVTCATEGATIYYELDGSDPDFRSPVYFSPLQISTSTTLKVYAEKEGMRPSAINAAVYTINLPPPTGNPLPEDMPPPALKITPNPASDVVRISWSNMVYTLKGTRLIVTDTRGAVVHDALVKGGYTYHEFSVARLAGGVYYVKAWSGQTVAKGKFIVSK